MWREGCREGFGVELSTQEPRYKYRGEWRQNLWHGWGELYAENHIYKGLWHNGKYSGYGKLFEERQVYEGGFLKGARHLYGGFLTKIEVIIVNDEIIIFLQKNIYIYLQ
jgi:hypothetical protein